MSSGERAGTCGPPLEVEEWGTWELAVWEQQHSLITLSWGPSPTHHHHQVSPTVEVPQSKVALLSWDRMEWVLQSKQALGGGTAGARSWRG